MIDQFWEERYQRAAHAGHLLFPKTASDAVVYTLEHLVPKTSTGKQPVAIDTGAGEGRHSRELARLGYRVIATEVSPTAVAQGTKRFLRADGLETGTFTTNLLSNDYYQPVPGVNLSKQVEWVLGDCRTWQPETPVDLVLGAFIHQVPGGIIPALPNLVSWVKPGGFLVLVGHSRLQYGRAVGGPKKAEMLWLASELTEAINKLGFTVSYAADVARTELFELINQRKPENPPALEQTPVETIVVAQHL